MLQKSSDGVNGGIQVSVICTLIFLLVQLIGAMHHEPWMDEFQAFQIAMNSHSLSNLFYNLRYEGHPAAWHLLLYVITRFTDNIFAMQVVHIIIASAGIFLLFRYAPFTFFQKILISLGYFIFYEYAQISRCYVIGVFAALCICSVLGEKYFKSKREDKKALTPNVLILVATFLVLLINSSSYGLLIACGLVLYLLLIIQEQWSLIASSRILKISLASCIALVLIGYGTSILMLLPKPDSFIRASFPSGFDLSFFSAVAQQPLMAYFPIPYSTDIGCWCSSFVFHCNPSIVACVSLITILLIAFAFCKKPRVLFLFLFLTLLIAAFLLYFPHWWVAPRYYGHLFLVVLICFWLDGYTAQSSHIFKVIPDSLITGLKKTLFYTILIVQAIVGIYFYYLDYRYPFSNTSKAGEYVVKNHLERLPLIGGIDVFILPLSYYTHQPVYSFERNDSTRFVIYDTRKKNTVSPAEATKQITHLIDNSKTDTVLVCLSFMWKTIDSTGAMNDFTEGTFGEGYHVKLIQKIEAPSILAGNNFYFFLAWKKKTEMDNM